MVEMMGVVAMVVMLCVASVGGADGAGVGCPMRAAFGRRALKQVPAGPPLQFGYYATTCPNVEQIVADRVNYWTLQDITTPAKLLRLFFHDCVAAGCEGSILLNSTAQFAAEKDAPISATLGKFFVIDDIKASLEAQCPGVVSCADILALAAIKSVAITGGPSFDIELGRRDGTTSYLAAATASVPLGTMKVDALVASLALAGLDINDLVALSGAHTIGQVHCSSFTDRFDPSLNTPFVDAQFGSQLQTFCANGKATQQDLVTSLDYQSPNIFDTSYFSSLVQGQGVLTSDQDLYNDPRTQPMVKSFASNPPAFYTAFQASMLKMGNQGVLTGTNGIIRQKCWTV